MFFSLNKDERVRIKKGIPSLSEYSKSPRIATEEILYKLSDRIEEGSINDAVQMLLEDESNAELIDAIFKTRSESWRLLAERQIGGTCLVVNDLLGKRTRLLAEICESVLTINESLSELTVGHAVAAANEQQNIDYIHGSLEDVSLPTDTFDTVVISRKDVTPDGLTQLQECLNPQGSLLLFTEGWPRKLGVTTLLGMEPENNRTLPSPKQTFTATARGLSRLIQQEGMHVAERYAILSSDRHTSEWIYDIDDSETVGWVLRGAEKEGISGPLAIARSMASAANRLGLLQQCYPTYLFVASPEPQTTSAKESSILLTGKNRSAILCLNDGTVTKAKKVPNSHAQSPLTGQEIDLLAELRESPHEISATIPTGEAVDTRFGREWHEDPVAGKPLFQKYGTDPDDIEELLTIVLDWLAQFQSVYERKRVERSPDIVRSELLVSQFDLEPPDLPNDSLDSCVVPMHGDLFGTNIYVDDKEVVEVIDWEWSSDHEPPGSDFGFFILEIANRVGKDFKDGFEMFFLNPTPYRPIVQNAIETHARRTNISVEELLLYLPYAYLHRIQKDIQYNRRLDINWPERVSYVWEHYEVLKDQFLDE